MSTQFDLQLAQHCAPALAGIKAASLFSCFKKDFPAFESLLLQYQQAFAETDIRFCVLCQCSKRYLLLVYRESALGKQLFLPLVQKILQDAGYPDGSLSELLNHLRKRFAQTASFPHEIGVFLGYPPEDVIAFQTHKGKNFSLCGYWKVYGDPHQARQTFYRFDRCRDAVCRRLNQGYSIAQIFGAA